jgi:hypothetical protein
VVLNSPCGGWHLAAGGCMASRPLRLGLVLSARCTLPPCVHACVAWVPSGRTCDRIPIMGRSLRLVDLGTTRTAPLRSRASRQRSCFSVRG